MHELAGYGRSHKDGPMLCWGWLLIGVTNMRLLTTFFSGKLKKNIEMKNHKSLRLQYLFLTDAVSSERAGCCC